MRELEEKTQEDFPGLAVKEDFELVRPRSQGSKRKKTPQQPDTDNLQINVSNKFAPLTSPEDGESDSNKTENREQPLTEKAYQANTQNLDPAKYSTAPIILRDKSKWVQVSNLLKTKHLNYTKATSLKDGIKIQPQSHADYKATKELLLNNQYEFHTHLPRNEKHLKVVIKGVPIKSEEVAIELESIGYPAEKITRMNKKGNVPTQMVLVEIKREYKSIYNITNLFGLSVTAEPLKNKGFTIQCHSCQIFGHAQINCNAQFKCMKCGESHSTHLCAKPKTTPPKCANCQGEHTSIYKKCPVRPNILNTPEKITQKPEKPWNKTQGKTTRKPQIENLTTKTDENPTNPNSKTKKISQILGNMLLEFCTLNPTDMQMQSFNKQILSIINKTNLKTMQSRIPDSLPIKIMAWNANGIISKKLETEQYLIEQHIDIALISETHLRPGDKFKTPNYKTYRKDRDQNGRQGGGVAILIRNSKSTYNFQIPPQMRE
nr:PREDICTED: nucleic-acid-binding protein from mobile element jockey [Tribolium castaneum]|eukprot:XP_008193154.2 PREDICTED: nucleic-acid-binding protein from mobile element jockey [Tribolium castaneum]